ncbi:N-acetylmuramoyl-L-alanine amidase [Psychrobacillus sp. INOP01]|uniref:N-acetylmuramoyl-L-alanine amidase n=1 Tax=Psychrobacillus sp. INOP01 TaxID=2829187 RepID=UPI001BAAC112|nr:N-acetylmuramoyl-L-alanine amidase [Psychrobacillus sp. INOP01]QUG40765.1 N-acetylmuramoyl-L-alanine amidase [Psychrobacillus sp. INOP01]
MLGKIKQIVTISLMLVLAFSLSLQANAANTFSDVSNSDEGYQEIEYIYSKGIIKGYESGGTQKFKPTEVLTRYQAAKMLVLAGGHGPLKVSKSSFKDVKLKESEYIEQAVKLGYMKGTGNGNFSPFKPFTRDDMSIALVKTFKLNLTEFANKPIVFSDINNNDEIAKYIKAIYYNGITQGSDNKYMPNSGVTRRQFSLFVARGMEDEFKVYKEVDGATLPDPSKSIGQVIIKVSNDTLNVRTEPNNSGTVVGKLVDKEKVFVYEVTGDWLKIDYKGELQYISSAYTSFLDINGKEIGASTGKVLTTSPDLNIRSKPTTSGAIISTVSKNTELQTYGLYDGWYLVKVGNIPGYISANYTEDATIPGDSGSDDLGDVIGKVTAASLNVRSGPGATYASVGSLTKGKIVTVESLNGSWAKVKYSGGQGYVSKTYLKLLNQTGSVLKNRIILMDAGHGGKDPGASNQGVTEKSIVIKVAKLVEQKLKNAGATVIMSRSGDTYPSLQDRVELSKSTNSELFVSIHVNAAANKSVTGTETFYNLSLNDNGAESKVLATKIQQEIVKNAGMNNRGIKEGEFYVIKRLEIPSVLVELGFITNQQDLNKLVNDKYIEIYAQSIFNGIRDYYSIQ